ncbi:MAG: hypothetical protein KatS3mg044_0129 [Rhodothermaceae bacterium]|nr:MAG: hypothetical protein KatS3mg044_0129 [Rhodothermaceae bacterium]
MMMAAMAPGSRAQVETRGVALLATAGGGPAFVRDNDAIHFNPANLLFTDRGARVVLSLGNTRAFTGGDLLQFHYYNEYLASGRTLSDGEVVQMLDGWFGSTGATTLRRAGLHADVVPLALTYRGGSWALGLAVRTRSFNQVGLSRGWFDLLLRGTGENRDLPVNASMQALNMTDLTVAFTYRFDRLFVGLAPKVVLGHSFTDTRFTSTVSVSDDVVEHVYDYTARAAGSFSRDVFDAFDLFADDPFADVAFTNPFGSQAGTGFGADVGITYVAAPGVLVAASLTDLGQIAWNRDAQTVTPVNTTFRFEGLTLNQDRIDREFDGDFGRYAESVLDSLARDAYDEVNRVYGRFTTSLPTAFHFGTAWYHGRATVNMGLSVALNEAPGNLTRKPSVYTGGEYRLGPVPLRAGVRLGGDGAMTLGVGLGLRTPVYEFGLSVAATPKSDVMGAGGRYVVALSLINLHL